jgi:hypothetical protein
LGVLSFPAVNTQINKIEGKATELGKEIMDKLPAKLSYLLGMVDTIKNAITFPFNFVSEMFGDLLEIIKKVIQFNIPGAFADAKDYFKNKLIPKIENIEKMIMDFLKPLVEKLIGKYEGGKEILDNIIDNGLGFYDNMFNIEDKKSNLGKSLNSTKQIYDNISKEGTVDPMSLKDSYLVQNGQSFYMTAATFATDMTDTYKDIDAASQYEGGMSKYFTTKSIIMFIKSLVDTLKRIIPAIFMEAINICLKYFLTNDINKYFNENSTKLIDKLGFGILGIPFAGATISGILSGFGITIPQIDVSSFLTVPETKY